VTWGNHIYKNKLAYIHNLKISSAFTVVYLKKSQDMRLSNLAEVVIVPDLYPEGNG
jgi:hypothetical protein